jgi:sugar phosphate isomerase/epimerase
MCSLNQPLPADMALWADLGVTHVGLISPKLEAQGWEAARELISNAGLRVSNLSSENAVISESVQFAASVGAPTVYFCTDRATSPTWEEAAASFCDSIAPLVSVASQLGVTLAIEPTNPLRPHRSFIFCLRDAIDLARAAGVSVVLDIYSCWYERGLAELVEKNVDRLALVQLCDYVLGTFDSPNRAVPGDGDIPLARLISALLDAGYQGPFDIEVLGPRIEAEGYASAIRRSIERTGALLEKLGA